MATESIHDPDSAVGPRLLGRLRACLVLFAILVANAGYLALVTGVERWTDTTVQNTFTQWMFLGHVVLGLVLIPAFIAFVTPHLRRALDRPNRRAVRAGLGLLALALVVLVTGVLLLRVGGLAIRDPAWRGVLYAAHVVAPILVVWAFILHRLAGPKIHWQVGFVSGAAVVVFAGLLVGFHSADPREWNVIGPASGARYFEPSLVRTATGGFVPGDVLMQDDTCQRCHADTHDRWKHSAHRFASFNNPAYLFSVRETRRVSLERDGTVQASRFCAGCHDPVPFLSGAFDDPNFDDERDPTAHAGITCTVCHAITHVNDRRGNASYTIEEPLLYPFATSEHPALRWIHDQLVKARPAFHKKTFLKPLHRSPDFCGTCHKVHLPEALNGYKFLRGQNHFDSFWLSGVSGHGVASFYYPKRAETGCNRCHMPLRPSTDFGARRYEDQESLAVHDHLFPAANTAVPVLTDMPPEIVREHQAFLEDILTIDLFALRRENGELLAPLGPGTPALRPGETVELDLVIRTRGVGHAFTQGTADSNEIWIELVARAGERVIGGSGFRGEDGAVDPWAYFVNAYVLDRDGRRIDRRNAQDIFVPLYDHQIPPGAADVVRYSLTVPEDVDGPLSVEARLLYRKFDTTYMRYVFGPEWKNDLPITVLAEDARTLETGSKAGGDETGARQATAQPLWERWNDYGIGLMRKGRNAKSGELRQADAAFREVESLGHTDGTVNRARVALAEGRLDDAAALLRKAADGDPGAPWTVTWLTGLVEQQRGRLEDAHRAFRRLEETAFPTARQRGFDFSKDYRLLNHLGMVELEMARRPGTTEPERVASLESAREWFHATLEIDVENVTAHHNLGIVEALLGNREEAARHRQLHERYRPDDNRGDRAIRAHRLANPAADHAAEPMAVYELRAPRDGSPAS